MKEESDMKELLDLLSSYPIKGIESLTQTNNFQQSFLPCVSHKGNWKFDKNIPKMEPITEYPIKGIERDLLPCFLLLLLLLYPIKGIESYEKGAVRLNIFATVSHKGNWKKYQTIHCNIL